MFRRRKFNPFFEWLPSLLYLLPLYKLLDIGFFLLLLVHVLCMVMIHACTIVNTILDS